MPRRNSYPQACCGRGSVSLSCPTSQSDGGSGLSQSVTTRTIQRRRDRCTNVARCKVREPVNWFLESNSVSKFARFPMVSGIRPVQGVNRHMRTRIFQPAVTDIHVQNGTPYEFLLCRNLPPILPFSTINRAFRLVSSPTSEGIEPCNQNRKQKKSKQNK